MKSLTTMYALFVLIVLVMLQFQQNVVLL